MKNTFKSTFSVIILMIAILLIVSGCDGNDDVQSSPTDGFNLNNTFYSTANAYLTVDQADANNDGYPDSYNFFFTDGRMTDTFGDVGIGYAYSTNTTTKLVKLKALADASNPSLTTNTLTVGNTYVASSLLTTGFNAGFSADSFISYNLQPSTAFGTENGLDFSHIPETIGIWNYVGTSGPTITINAINIDYTTPANSTADVDYTFLDANGNQITGHYQGTLGVIRD